MDDRLAAWILEFLLRQPAVDDWIVGRLISVLPVADDDLRLKQAILLRALRSEVSRPSLSERTLILLESFNSLDHGGGAALSDHARVAYCAAAVEATVRYLREDPPNFEEFVCAVDRVWKARVAEVEAREECWRGLNSEALRHAKKEMLAAVGNERVRQEVVERDTRGPAVEAVRAFVEAAEREFGPTFLESAAGALLSGRLRLPNGKASAANAIALGDDNMTLPPSLTYTERKIQPCKDADTTFKDMKHSTEEADANAMALEDDMTLPPSSTGAEREIQPCREVDAAVEDMNNTTEGADTNLAGEKSHQGPSTRSDCIRYDPLPTSGVKRILQALVSSSRDLKSIVEDPLPAALETITNMQRNHGAQDTEKTCLKENHNVTYGDEQVASMENDVETVHEVATVENENERNQEGRTWPGFNARNPTAQTYEWSDDSPTQDSPGCSRKVYLPSPKKRVVSPLKVEEAQKFVRRRKHKRWSTLEEDTLRDAVREYGRGNWKAMLSTYSEIFEDRTEVDLKDKWRNMVR